MLPTKLYAINYEKKINVVYVNLPIMNQLSYPVADQKIKNFFSIGRQGQFYYGDIDQMIRIGFDTADKIIRN